LLVSLTDATIEPTSASAGNLFALRFFFNRLNLFSSVPASTVFNVPALLLRAVNLLLSFSYSTT
jgi:hypothetical protein